MAKHPSRIMRAFLPSSRYKAGQSCEVETLTPLIHRCNKLILVGDPKQLPPTVISMVSVFMLRSRGLFLFFKGQLFFGLSSVL
jgi:hypothetical protein